MPAYQPALLPGPAAQGCDVLQRVRHCRRRGTACALEPSVSAAWQTASFEVHSSKAHSLQGVSRLSLCWLECARCKLIVLLK